MLDQRVDPLIEIVGNEVVFQEDAEFFRGRCNRSVCHALHLDVERRALDVAHASALDIVGPFLGDIAWAVLSELWWLTPIRCRQAARRRQWNKRSYSDSTLELRRGFQSSLE